MPGGGGTYQKIIFIFREGVCEGLCDFFLPGGGCVCVCVCVCVGGLLARIPS